MVKVSPPSLLPVARVASRIYLLRNQKVMLDFDLAELYGVPTKAFNQAVTRNAERFPEDFMFRLSREEAEAMNRSQIVTGSQKHRDPRFTPRAFTQEGVAMLSGGASQHACCGNQCCHHAGVCPSPGDTGNPRGVSPQGGAA